MLRGRVTELLSIAERDTTAEQDDALLQPAAAPLSSRERMAVVTRLGEKRMLQAVRAELELQRERVN